VWATLVTPHGVQSLAEFFLRQIARFNWVARICGP
jgi:hypothetical protein